jgi:hypothetical protein
MGEPGARALVEGVTDAAGFVVGALVGALLGRFIGWDFLAEAGYTMRAVLGIALVGVCAGVGLKVARLSLRRKADRPPR